MKLVSMPKSKTTTIKINYQPSYDFVPELDLIKKKISRKEGLLALDEHVVRSSGHIFPVAFQNREP